MFHIALCDRYVNRVVMISTKDSLGIAAENDREMKYWTSWVADRMSAVRETCKAIDMFVAPSVHLRERFVKEFGLPQEKVTLLPYGFDRSILTHRQRRRLADEPFVFGYIGRQSPSKGINLLLEAARHITVRTQSNLSQRFCLAIYGRPDATTTGYLQAMATSAGISVEWRPEYKNSEIVSRVFNRVDCIVVPSIWDENSPLVIHEAQQCRVPVITADRGGMVNNAIEESFSSLLCLSLFRANWFKTVSMD